MAEGHLAWPSVFLGRKCFWVLGGDRKDLRNAGRSGGLGDSQWGERLGLSGGSLLFPEKGCREEGEVPPVGCCQAEDESV